MKQTLQTLILLGLIASQPAVGQQAQQPKPRTVNQAAPEVTFTKFDLDFPGGTPAELVAAIEKATGKPLNAIIPTEHANVNLPTLKMRNVAAPTLFDALIATTLRTVPYDTRRYSPRGGSHVQNYRESYGFRSQAGGLNLGDETVWYFHYEKHTPPPKFSECRYYQLDSYLESYSIDDITTAIQTGWRMLDEKDEPELSFHKETSLLIAVGSPGDLELIDTVLLQLSQALPRPAPMAPAAPAPESE